MEMGALGAGGHLVQKVDHKGFTQQIEGVTRETETLGIKEKVVEMRIVGHGRLLFVV